MDTDAFFGFDTTIPPEDEEDLDYDEEYDALNDETFGSAAVGGDWEEKHEQFATLKEGKKLHANKNNELNSIPIDQLEKLSMQNINDKRSSSPFEVGSFEKPRRLFERSVNLGSDLSSSPGNSIWTPTRELVNRNNDVKFSSQPNSFNEKKILNGAYNMISPPPGIGKCAETFKTVDEIERDLKRNPLMMSNNSLPKPKQMTYTVEDLEKNLRMTHPPSSSSYNAPSHPLMMMQQPPNQNNYPFRPAVHPPYQYMPPINHPGFRERPPPIFANMKRKVMPMMPTSNMHPHHHVLNGNMRSLNMFNVARMPINNKGFPMNNQPIRNPNAMMDRRNYDQNLRFDLMRMNHFDHQQRDHLVNGRPHENGINQVRRDSDVEWDEWQRKRLLDEYSGLMTPKEKAWLRNIQEMQLQTDNPYQDDYYYVMHSVKHDKTREEDIIEVNGSPLLLNRDKEEKEYQPPKLENSLGKLQVASVNAPRKTIDLQVIHLDSSHPTTSLQRDMRKHRTLLMHIEKLYDIMIELDDLHRKIRALHDCPTRDSFRSKCSQLLSKLWKGLTSPHEMFVQILCLKKGKYLTARLMGWAGKEQIEHILATIIQNLPLLHKKDIVDKRMNLFWPFAERLMSVISTESLVNFGIMIESQLKIQKNASIPAFENKLVLSVLLAMLIKAENHWNELQHEKRWSEFLNNVVNALNLNTNQPLEPLISVNLIGSLKHPSIQIQRIINDTNYNEVKKAIEVLNQR